MNNQTDKFVERFSGLFEKAGINLSKIEESKEEAQKVQQQDTKKLGFFAAVLAAVGVSYYVSKKFGGVGHQQPPPEL